jgi:Flp pilus assembly protein TadG
VRSLGGIAVEFALIFPAAIAIFLGGIDLGRMVACRAMLTYAVAEGAQKAAALATPDVATVETVVQNASPMLGLAGTDIDVLLVPSTTENAPAFATRVAGNSVSVKATYIFQPMIYPSWQKTWTETSAALRVQ